MIKRLLSVFRSIIPLPRAASPPAVENKVDHEGITRSCGSSPSSCTSSEDSSHVLVRRVSVMRPRTLAQVPWDYHA